MPQPVVAGLICSGELRTDNARFKRGMCGNGHQARRQLRDLQHLPASERGRCALSTIAVPFEYFARLFADAFC